MKQDIHAKIFLRRKYSDTSLYIGSMNASYAASQKNVEMVMQLKTKNRYLNGDSFLRDIFCGEADNPANPFEKTEIKEAKPDDAEEESKVLEKIIKDICRRKMKATVVLNDEAYDVSVTVDGEVSEEWDNVRIGPLRRKVLSPFAKEMIFERLDVLQLTEFYQLQINQDVFELFDHNVPYELRLRDAIANDLVVPFKYFGIRDKLVDYGLTGNEERRMIAQMAKEDHCDFIAEQIEKHRPQGKLKALAFCRNVTHARMMCEALGERYHTAYLTGRNDIGERVRAYNDLQNDAHNLEILFTVDILNEGVDIPGVNMVLFLRPTESTTIFIQQLGRGLRKYTNKEYVTVLDFIGNSYKRSVQIAFALGSLSENFVMEKRLLASLVKDDFTALGLADYGVEIHIDDLSKEEILEYIDKENFNSLKYLKQDYFNFKKYIGSEFYPRHVDYINNDCAPDLIRFMSIKTRGKKNCSYYNFLRGIGEENLPVFTEKQIDFINYLSGLLPLVRVHEYQIVKLLLDGPKTYQEIVMYLTETVQGFVLAELEHVLTYLQFVEKDKNILRLSVPMDDQLLEYVQDLIEYGLIRYVIDNGNETGFKLWLNYRMDQVQLKLLKNPGNIMVGTYYYDDYVVIFASLKKDLEEADKLNYKDKFLQPDLFQWESMTNLPQSHLEKLMKSTFAHVFIRKMTTENGLVLPFTYVGKGKMSNPRKTDGDNGTYLFDIHMENELPEYLQYDFGLTKE